MLLAVLDELATELLDERKLLDETATELLDERRLLELTITTLCELLDSLAWLLEDSGAELLVDGFQLRI